MLMIVLGFQPPNWKASKHMRNYLNLWLKAFFFLHTINAYEEKGHLVVDICAYDSPDMMDCMYIEKLQTAQSNKNYAPLFKGSKKVL